MNGGSRSLAVVLASALVGSAAPALGEPRPASEKDRQIASDLVKKAIAKSSAGDHETAIKLYVQAYTLVPNSLLLSNIGAEFQQDGMPKEALEYFCKYLLEDPTGTNAPYARSQAKILSRQLGKKKVSDRDVCAKDRDRDDDDATDDTARTPPRGESPRAEPGRADIGRTEPRADVERPVKLPRSEPDSGTRPAGPERSQPFDPPGAHVTHDESSSSGSPILMYSGVAIGVAGLIAAGIGVYDGFQAKKISDDISNHPVTTDWPEDIRVQQTRGQRYEDLQIGFLIASGVLVTTGVVLYVMGRPDGSHDHSDKVAVGVAPTANGAVVFGRF